MWKEYEPFIQAVVELFHPLVEVAVHDLEQGKIVALYHNLSQRKVGDPSPLKELNVQTDDFPPYFTPYYKQNYDGRELKCTSITLRKKGKPVALICINMDISFFQEGRRFIESFLKIKQEAEHPIDLYGSELEEQTMAIVHQYLQEKNWGFNHLNRSQKRELTQELYRRGVFNYKNAVPFLAKKLDVSRATIYNYIREEEPSLK